MQPLTHGKSGHHVEQRDAGQGNDHIGAGQFKVDRIREDRDRRGQAHPGVQHLAVLVRTGPDKPDVVRPGQPQGGDPEHRQGQAQGQVRRRDVVSEPDLRRHEHAEHGTAEVGECHLAQVVPGPGG